MRFAFWAASALAAALALCAPARAQLTVVSTSPGLNANNVAPGAPVSVTFDRPVDPASFTPSSFKLFGKLSGIIQPDGGALQFSNGDRTVTLVPSRPLLTGETAMMIMSRSLRGADAVPLRSAGYTFMYTVRAAPAPARFRQIASITNRINNAQTRIYGGLACDLDRDGWSDITTVNEVSADLRVFMNRADGSGLFHPMLLPPTPVPQDTSPNEVGDFDNDGFIDGVFSSDTQNRIAIARGNGNGTFQSPVVVPVGQNARGFGVLDCDGDGDMDIAVACTVSNNIALLINDGAGNFAAPSFFSVPGSNGPYGMFAADMNNDGILDLVVGCRNSQTCAIMRGNGNGTFTFSASRPIGGSNWVIVCGDLDNDGNMDVSAANAGSFNGSILMGNGDGTLDPAVIRATGGSTVSTDLADIDGDGDLDWVLSSFGAGLWYVYLNDGAGSFAPLQTVTAPANPSCAVPVDLNNDGMIDLLLTDEIADVMIVLINACPSDFNLSGGVPDDADVAAFFAAWNAGDESADFNESGGAPDDADVTAFFVAWNAGC